jgi:hypothetical protein
MLGLSLNEKPADPREKREAVGELGDGVPGVGFAEGATL